MRVEVPHERRLVVDRWQVVGPVIAASGGPAGQGVQAIRPGRSRNRTEPAITDGKLAGEMVVNRDVLGTVVTHDRSGVRVFSPAPEQRRGVAGHEAVHFAAAKLQVDGVGGVVGVPGDDRAVRWRMGYCDPGTRWPGPLADRRRHDGHLQVKGSRACGRRTDSRASRRRCGRSCQDWPYLYRPPRHPPLQNAAIGSYDSPSRPPGSSVAAAAGGGRGSIR